VARLRAGTATANLTPPVGAFLAGFASRTRPCEGIHDDLLARALVVEADGQRLALVSCDLIGLTTESVASIREMAEKAAGVPAASVLIACTHTHSGPTTGVLRHPGLDLEFVHIVEKKVAGAIAEAASNLADAALAVGRGRARIGVNRRQRQPDGSTTLGKNPEGPTDPDVAVVRVDGPGGRPLAIVACHACHPVVLAGGNYLVSADFPGRLAAFVEGVFPGCRCLFFNGGCGNINPVVVGGTFEDASRLGRFLGAEVVKVAEGLSPRPEAVVGTSSRAVEVPLAPLPSAEEARTTIEERTRVLEEQLASGAVSREVAEADWERGWAREVMSEYGKPDRLRALSLELMGVRLGNAALIGMPGEVFVEIALAVKNAAPLQPTAVVSYANGVVGYIPTARAFEEGGYEVERAYKFYRGVYAFTPEIEQVVTQGAVELANALASSS